MKCRNNRKPRHKLQDDLPEQEYSPESGQPIDRQANEFTQASESVFWYNPDEEGKQASREETPTKAKKDCVKAKATTIQRQEEASWHSAPLGGTRVTEEKIKENTVQISTQEGKINERTRDKRKEKTNNDKKDEKTYRASTLKKGSKNKPEERSEERPKENPEEKSEKPTEITKKAEDQRAG